MKGKWWKLRYIRESSDIRVADPGGVDPDLTLKKNPGYGYGHDCQKKPDPDPDSSLEKKTIRIRNPRRYIFGIEEITKILNK